MVLGSKFIMTKFLNLQPTNVTFRTENLNIHELTRNFNLKF